MTENAPAFERPTAVNALRAVLQSDWPDELQAERINIQVLESGEVAYRLHPAGGGEYVGGVTTVQKTLSEFG